MRALTYAIATFAVAGMSACAEPEQTEETAASPEQSELALLAGGFTASCQNIGLNFPQGHKRGDGWIQADCLRRDGSWRYSALNLDQVLGNDNGRLVTPGLGYSYSCDTVNLDYTSYLVAKCRVRPPAVGTIVNRINLNDCVSNDDGALAWHCP